MTHLILSSVALDPQYRDQARLQALYQTRVECYEHQTNRAGFVFLCPALEQQVALHSQDPVTREGGTRALKNLADVFARLAGQEIPITVFPLHHKPDVPSQILENYRRFEVWHNEEDC
jgi:hypothetical protein